MMSPKVPSAFAVEMLACKESGEFVKKRFEKRSNYFIIEDMTTINIQELPPAAAEAIRNALAAGEDVFITNDQQERLAQVTSLHDAGKLLSDKPIRKGGFAKGKIHLSEAWDSPETNDEIAREFGMLD